SATPVSRSLPVILIKFQDDEPPFGPDDYRALLFGAPDDPEAPRKRTLRNYFRDNSRGLLNLDGQVTSWYKLAVTEADALAAKQRGDGLVFGRLLEDA